MELHYEFDEGDYDYEPDDQELLEYEGKLFAKDYGISLEIAINIIEDWDLYENMEDAYEDEIYNHFSKEAHELCQEKYYYSEAGSIYGVSENDFH